MTCVKITRGKVAMYLQHNWDIFSLGVHSEILIAVTYVRTPLWVLLKPLLQRDFIWKKLLAVEFKASKQENEVEFVCAIESPRLQKDAFVSKLFAKQLTWTRNIFLR